MPPKKIIGKTEMSFKPDDWRKVYKKIDRLLYFI